MDAAPSVEVTAGGDPLARWGVALLAALSAASLASWGIHGAGGVGWAGAVAALSAASLASAVALGFWRRRTAPIVLRWDGRAWSVLDADAGPPCVGRVTVAIDLDFWMLLRFDGDRGRRWIALSRAVHCTRWHGMRCALYSRRLDADPFAATRT